MTPEELETKVMDAICDTFSLRDRCGGYRCEQCRREAKVIVPLILEVAAKAVEEMPRTYDKVKEDHNVLGMKGTCTFTLNNGPAECAAVIRALKGAGDVQQA